VTGTGTGVGKSVLAGAVVARLRAEGVRVRALKPIITGLDEPPEPCWPPDHELLARAAGCSSDEVALMRFGPPVSPHLAAELAGRAVDPGWLCGAVREAAAGAEAVIVEGVGGLLVPLSGDYAVRAFARDLGLPVLIAAAAGLGTINHTLLTLEAARAHGLDVVAVVLTPWPGRPGAIELSNRDTIARLGAVEVHTLPEISSADPQLLAAAGGFLPLARWLSSRRAAAAAA
jgi:dethiobiotin synthetase